MNKRGRQAHGSPGMNVELEKALRYHRSGRFEMAEPIYRNILVADPDHPDALHLLGVLAHQTGRHDIAIELIGKAIRNDPHAPQYYDNMGNACASLGRLEEAVSCYQSALRLRPDSAGALSNLANVLKSLGRLEEAVSCYERAMALEPGLAEPCNNLGNLLKALGRIGEAIDLFRKAVKLKPGYAEAHNNLGVALHDQGKADEASVSFRKALDLKPDLAEVHNNLGNLLKDQGNVMEAISSIRRALELQPGYAEACNNMGLALVDLGEIEGAVSLYARARELKPDNPGYHSNYLLGLHYSEKYDRKVLSGEAMEWGRKHGSRSGSPRPFTNTADPGRRIRVGYVSGDFRRHPVGYFIGPILACHDRDMFEVYCYANQHESDDLTRRFQSLPVHWRGIADLPDESAGALIVEDGIDILVDLSGHTARNRLLLFAEKPAPVQATWIGYSDTTGLGAIDFIIADRHVIPEEDRTLYTERPVRLPHSYLCYSPPAYAPEENGLPAQRNGHITFGSFNNIAKVSLTAIETWSKVLREVPDSRLCVKASVLDVQALKGKYLEFFAMNGIGEDRIDVAGRSPNHRELLVGYGNIDIALDTFPYAGTTTTAEALWMGVPVVTLAAGAFVGRVGGSLLSTVGLSEFVARTSDEYIAIAAALAGDRERLVGLRSTLRRKMKESPLCDGKTFTRDLEGLYRGMWRQWSGRKEDSL